MKWNSKSIVVKFIFISRITLLSSIVFFASASISSQGAIGLTGGLFTIGALLLCVSFIAPGILIIFRRPDLASAWLRGIHPFAYSNASWEELSSGQRKSVYVGSMIPLFFVVAFIVWVISEQ